LGGLDGGDAGQVEVGAVEVADPVWVAVGQDYPGGVGDDEVIDARLLCRFDEEFLERRCGPRPRRIGSKLRPFPAAGGWFPFSAGSGFAWS